MAHNCNPSIQEAEAGGLQLQGQPRLHIETLPHNKKMIFIFKTQGEGAGDTAQ
jgi:hypothetical protein